MKVLAVILNYNLNRECINCAELLKKQTYKDFDICIVDNNSPNSTVELEEYCKNNKVVFLKNNTNSGYSAGNNVGIRYGYDNKYDYVMIINPDVEIYDDKYIKVVVDKVSKLENIAILGTDIYDNKSEHQNPTRELNLFEELVWPFTIVRDKFSKNNPYLQNYKVDGYCYRLHGCCFFINTKFANEIGYLDEKVFMYNEESIIAKTVSDSNYNAYYISDIKAFHNHKDGDPKNKGRNMRRYFETRKYYLKEYSDYSKLTLKLIFIMLDLQKFLLWRK